jgi:hypothetical protein
VSSTKQTFLLLLTIHSSASYTVSIKLFSVLLKSTIQEYDYRYDNGIRQPKTSPTLSSISGRFNNIGEWIVMHQPSVFIFRQLVRHRITDKYISNCTPKPIRWLKSRYLVTKKKLASQS